MFLATKEKNTNKFICTTSSFLETKLELTNCPLRYYRK